MLKILAALKYHAQIMAVVQFIEATVPDDTPGLRKLDMALKALIRWDAKIGEVVPEVTQLIAGAKAVFNEVKSAADSVKA